MRFPLPFGYSARLPVKRPLLYNLLGLLLAALIFALDSFTPLGIAGGFPYIALVFIGLAAHSPKSVWLFAGLSTMLTIGGYFLATEPVAPFNAVIINRAITVLAIWFTAGMAYLYLHSVLTLKPLADRDQLTGTYNRHALVTKAGEHIKLWRRYHSPLSLILGDVDHFKKINDTYGHPAGDRVLQHLARLLQQHTRNADMVCRYGGEEFVILLPMVGLEGALATAQRIQHALSKSAITWKSATLSPTVSMGVVELLDKHRDIEALIADADKALYEAKAAGRNRIRPIPSSTGPG